MNTKNQSLSRIYYCLFLGLLLTALCGIANAQTSRVSVNSSGGQANLGASAYTNPSISANGRFVTFGSTSSDLAPGGVTGDEAIYFHDRLTQQTSRVSVSSDGVAGPGLFPSMSFDGHYVVFESWGDLVEGDTNGLNDVFIHDNATNKTSLVSVSSQGGQGNNMSNKASISADGRFVVFESFADNLVPGDTNGVSDIFVRDLVAKTTTRVSVDSNGRQGNSYSGAGLPSISGDGRFVAFTSLSENLVANDKNRTWDAFVHDNFSGQTISLTNNITIGNSPMFLGGVDAKLSANGQFAVFVATANPYAGFQGATALTKTLIYNVFNGQITFAIADAPGLPTDNGGGNANISGDGHFLAFNAPTQDDNLSNIFMQDQVTNQTFLISGNSSGVQGNNHSFLPTISTDGRHIVYLSAANNLVPGDTNNAIDVFVLDF
jgi:WD40-like Beta Propeller Repeat